jgi:hypothetical protein
MNDRGRPLAAVLAVAVAAAAIAVPPPAPADHDAAHYQVHGFAAQGFALSDGNDIIGESTEGNLQYFEIGVNAKVQGPFGLSVSAQELVRRSGGLDDGDLRLDYGFIDWQAVGSAAFDAGVRAGRVKNPFGLFNETRDVVFTRPGILLPSVYYETQGARSLLFASDGGQAYAGWAHGSQYTSLMVTRAADFDASTDDKRVFFAGSALPLGGDLRFSDFLVARVMNDWSAGRVRVAASYLTANLAYTPAPSDPVPVSGDIDFALYMLSARYNAERLSLTAEYLLTHSEGSFGSPRENDSDAAYVQADYRFAAGWAAMARAEAYFSDRTDRQGDRCTANGAPADRHGCFTLGGGAGLQWQPGEHWGLWAEYYAFDGTALVPTIENPGRSKEPHWSLFLLMAAYRF